MKTTTHAQSATPGTAPFTPSALVRRLDWTLELLVALAIFAVIGTAAYVGLHGLLLQRTRLDAQAQRLVEVRRAVDLIALDLFQIVDRPVRDALGRVQPALLGGSAQRPWIEFTRTGWANPQSLPRPGLRRIGYDWHDRQLERLDWRSLERVDGSGPLRTRVLDAVRRIDVRFLDVHRGWLPDWPPRETADDPGQAGLLPGAVEFTLELDDFGSLTRRVPIAGARLAP